MGRIYRALIAAFAVLFGLGLALDVGVGRQRR